MKIYHVSKERKKLCTDYIAEDLIIEFDSFVLFGFNYDKRYIRNKRI